jgi:hypothetical protein
VVEAVGDANAGLWRALHAVFAAEIEREGTRVPAVPRDRAERRAVLDRYYQAMSQAED